MTDIEYGFSNFSDTEIEVGLKHAAEKDHISLDYGRLRKLANSAGLTRKNAPSKLSPREAASRAITSFNRAFPGSKIRDRYYEGYVHAIAKMMSERSPKTRAKRQREHEVEEVLALGHQIENTPNIDPKINEELSLFIAQKNQSGRP